MIARGRMNWLSHPADRVALAVLAAVIAVALLTFRDYGLGWDDLTHAQYGDLLLQLYASGFADTRALSFVNLYRYGGGFDMAAALLNKVLPFGLFETRRFLGAAVGIAGLAITWRLGRRVGGPVAGLLALILLAACPTYYGHMFFNPKDAPFAVAMVLLLLGLVRVLEEFPSPARSTVVMTGLGLGLSIGSRIMAGFGAIYGLVAIGVVATADMRASGARAAFARVGRLLLALLPAAILAYAIMAVIWPWAVVDPLNPLRAVRYFSTFFEKPWEELFRGALIAVPDMPRSYLPVMFGVKLPEVFLLLSLAGVLGTTCMAFRAGTPPKQRAILVVIALAATLPVVIAMAGRPAMYNGIRHFVFVLPPLAVAGGLAGAWTFDILRGRMARVAAIVAFLAAIALPVTAMTRLHPYQYTYFNTVAGGASGAQGRYMLDYWGLALRQASLALLSALGARGETPPAGQSWRIAVCGPHPPAEVVLGDRFHATWDPRGADFAMMLGAFYCARFDAPVLAEIKRAGVVFARVYDIRGRSYESLFTVPPVERDDDGRR